VREGVGESEFVCGYAEGAGRDPRTHTLTQAAHTLSLTATRDPNKI
jgi:hypothetical protein